MPPKRPPKRHSSPLAANEPPAAKRAAGDGDDAVHQSSTLASSSSASTVTAVAAAPAAATVVAAAAAAAATAAAAAAPPPSIFGSIGQWLSSTWHYVMGDADREQGGAAREQGSADREPAGEQGGADREPAGEQSGADREQDREPAGEQSGAAREQGGAAREQGGAAREQGGADREQSGADREFSAFYGALVKTKLVDRCLALPPHIEFPELRASTLYVRNCYEEYFRAFLGKCGPWNPAGPMPSYRIAVFTGSPGIGKSFFLFYVLWRLVAEDCSGVKELPCWSGEAAGEAAGDDRPPAVIEPSQLASEAVIESWRQHYGRIIACRGSRMIITKSSAVVRATEPMSSDLLLWDVRERQFFPPIKSRLMVFASPSKERLNELLKDDPVLLIMPPWTLRELKELREACFGEVPEDTLMRRFRIYGGNPRLVLRLASLSRSDDEQFVDAIAKAGNLGNIIAIENHGLYGESTIPSALLQVVPNAGARTCHLQFSSQYAGDRVYNEYIEQVRQEMKKFVLFGEQISPIATARGWIFERLCHDELPRGAASKLEPLGWTGASVNFPIPRNADGNSTVFQSLSELAAAPENTYCRPHITNFPAVDGIVRRGSRLYLLQVTVAKTHPVKVHGLQQVWDAFEEAGIAISEMRLVFVLPDSASVKRLFTAAQDYLTVANEQYQGHPAFLKKVTQWRCFAGAVRP